MKTIYYVLICLLMAGVVACEQKADVASGPAAAGKEQKKDAKPELAPGFADSLQVLLKDFAPQKLTAYAEMGAKEVKEFHVNFTGDMEKTENLLESVRVLVERRYATCEKIYVRIRVQDPNSSNGRVLSFTSNEKVNCPQ
jgi:hypothetical protein